MNILATLHPPDKDYGHMKIEEPKTPYSYYNEDDVEVSTDIEGNQYNKEIDADNLAELINKKTKGGAFSFEEVSMDQEKEDDTFRWSVDGDDDWDNLTEEEKERRHDFESKRKKHYNEYQMVKLARKLMQEELREIEEDENGGTSSSTRSNRVNNSSNNNNNNNNSNLQLLTTKDGNESVST